MAARPWWKKAVAWTPVVLLIGFVGYATYVFVALFSIATLIAERNSKVQGGLYVAAFGAILLFLVPAYLRTVWTRTFCRVATSPHDYVTVTEDAGPRLRVAESDEEEDKARANDALHTFPLKSDDEIVLPLHEGVRFCVLCQCLKPARTHHCSTCQRCILKMDHHCVWLSTCIGYSNYKFFLVFLAWALLGSAFLFGAFLQEVLWEATTSSAGLTGRAVQYIIVMVFAGIFAIATLSLLIYHLALLVPQNMTTIEHLDWQDARRDGIVPDEIRFIPEMIAAGSDVKRRLRLVRLANRPFNCGLRENWRQVFGPNPLLWAVPLWTSQGSGLRFPVQKRHADAGLLPH